MKSVYTEKDLLVIRSEYEALMELAARRCRNEEQIAWVRKAYELASTAHKGVRLHSGRPYMIYPLQVARIVVEKIGLGYHSICASLLLGILDNTSYTVEDIRNLFDDKTARQYSHHETNSNNRYIEDGNLLQPKAIGYVHQPIASYYYI